MNVLVINSGSSSVKYEWFDLARRASLASGLLQRIGERQATLHHRVGPPAAPTRDVRLERPVPDHRVALDWIGQLLRESGLIGADTQLDGIGHRVVHGGETFQQPCLIDDRVLEEIREQIPLAPLHNPANLLGIEAARRLAPDVPQVAVFDTAFHQSLPPVAYRYAVSEELYRKHRVRRYGFHGTSHRYVSREAARTLGRPVEEVNLIVFHLGNGASAAAVRGGRCVDTSMGMTPLEGLVMGTRSGDIDPGVVFYLARVTGQSLEQIDALLNQGSGLKGLCGVNDMRQVTQRMAQGDPDARLAHDLMAYRIKKYLGAYTAVLGHVDAVVFTGGIGENVPSIRAAACDGLGELGIELDSTLNEQPTEGPRELQRATSRVKILVVPTNEELQIALLTAATIREARSGLS